MNILNACRTLLKNTIVKEKNFLVLSEVLNVLWSAAINEKELIVQFVRIRFHSARLRVVIIWLWFICGTMIYRRTSGFTDA